MKLLKMVKIFIILVLALFITSVLVNFLIGRIIHNREEVTVPDLYNKDTMTAYKVLHEKKLRLRIIGEVFNKKVGANSIVSQVPPKDTIVREKKEIKVIVSKGGEYVEIPGVITMPLRMAEVAIKNAGALIGQEKFVYSRYLNKYKIVRQSPEPNTLAPKGCMVHLSVSKGMPPGHIKLMPNLIDLSQEQAEEVLNNEEIVYKIETREIDDIEKDNLVIEQMPVQDIDITDGKKVEIIVGKAVVVEDDASAPAVE
ncbi:PASTA domain-containing protein [bacterium]